MSSRLCLAVQPSSSLMRAALATIRAEHVDIMLIDLRIPDMRGDIIYQLAAATQPHLTYQSLFMTGDITSEAERIIAATNCPYLRKPFDITLAVQAIAALVGVAYHAPGEPPQTADPNLGSGDRDKTR